MDHGRDDGAKSDFEHGLQAPQDAAWYERLLTAIERVQREFAPDRDGAFTTMLDTCLDLVGGECGMVLLCGADGRMVTVASRQCPDDVDPGLPALQQIARLSCAAGSAVDGTLREAGDAVAVPLHVNETCVGVMALGGQSLDRVRLGGLTPFLTTCANLLERDRSERRRRRAKQQLGDRESQMQAVLDNIVDGIVSIDENGVVETANAAVEHIFGYTADEFVGKHVTELLGEPFRSRYEADILRYLRTGEQKLLDFDREIQGLRKDGRVFPIDFALSEISGRRRRLFVGIIRDISEHKERLAIMERERANNQTLELLVRIDALTGIANRRHFDETLEAEVRRAARDGAPLSLILCDVDHFKPFNDRYGHLAGDKALRSVARALDGAFQRSGELAARYGGEEFAVILPGTDAAAAAQLAESVRQRVCELSIPHGASPTADVVTISIGSASIRPDRRSEVQPLIESADRALYRAKRAGRNTVCVDTPPRGGLASVSG